MRLTATVCLALACLAGHGREIELPSDLEGWADWVLDGEAHRDCPFVYNSDAADRDDYICAWPGRLDLLVTAEGARFDHSWTVYGDVQWVVLPGDVNTWPEQVAVNERGAVVVLRNGAPSLRLVPGRHRIRGMFAWDERPPTLAIPSAIGLLALSVDGERIVRPRWTTEGLWLGDGEGSIPVRDELSTVVYRRLVDDVPTRLETVFEIEVAGTVREERLAPALPDGFVPLTIDSELPVRLSPEGELGVHVRPGTWRIVLEARATDVADSVTLAQPENNLPGEEIWGYQANPTLRATLPEGPRAVDPTQVGSPWTDLPTYLVEPGESLVVAERNRGLGDAGNQLYLQRDLWLDFDGGGFVFADSLAGNMRRGWRLDMVAPYTLMNAAERGEPLLVTRNDTLAGVEIRDAGVNVSALGRIDARDAIPVAGWQADFDRVDVRLNVPPGHRLVATVGVDDAASTWAGRWQLLDIFLVLIISLAAARLFGRIAGAVVLVGVVLTFHEPWVPLWTWLNLLAAVALARAAPTGRLRSVVRGYRATSFALLLLLFVPFAVNQIRIAIFPQLESPAHRVEHASWGLFELLSEVPPPEPAGVVFHDEGTRAREVAKKAALPLPSIPRYEEGAMLQTGPGRPDWDWRSYTLSWNGPVAADRDMRLIVLPALPVGILRIVGILGLGLFAAMFAFEIAGGRWRWRLPWRGAASGTASALLVALALAGGEPAAAQPPSAEILEELKERLLAPPSCVPGCAEVASASVEIDEETVTIHLGIHAAENVAVPLPGAIEGWRPQRITSSGAELNVRRDDAGLIWVPLPQGGHALTLEGTAPVVDAVELRFPAVPRAIDANSAYWHVAGIRNRTLPAGALNLSRIRDQEEGAPSWESGRLPVFLEVERSVRLGLDWEVDSRVRRVAPESGALNMAIPLLDGEAVLDEDVAVGADGVLVALGATTVHFGWRSALPRQSSFVLRSSAEHPWREVWRFHIGSQWNVTFNGVPESLPNPGTASRVAVLHPRPGETVEVAVSRPEAVAGATLAFDNVTVSTTVGAHHSRSQMVIAYRSTLGSSHVVRLPTGAVLESVHLDGRVEPVVAIGGELTVPIIPGEHTLMVNWTQAARPEETPGYGSAGKLTSRIDSLPARTWMALSEVAEGLRVGTPDIELGVPSSNLVIELAMPLDRWLLFTHGPRLGPAVLYWTELVAVLIAGLVLGRLDWTPLRTRHWLLLGLGFSTSTWLALGIVVIWLVAHGTRKFWGANISEPVYRLAQIGLGALTLAAFAAIVAGVGVGLLGDPDMHIAGFDSANRELRWFADRTESAVPKAYVFSVPLWVYKGLILAWALWLSFALIRWLPWIWQRFSAEGLWYRAEPGAR